VDNEKSALGVLEIQGALTGRLRVDEVDRIEDAAGRIRTPARFASEAYTLREHIDLVRRVVLAKASESSSSPSA